MQNETEIKITFKIMGMSCTTCSGIAERALSKAPGVHYASVNLATESAFVLADPNVTLEDLFTVVTNCGYKPKEFTGEDDSEEKYIQAKRDLAFTFTWGMPSMIVMCLAMFTNINTQPWYTWLELITGAIVIFYGARRTLRGAWIAAIHYHTNMDTLISMSAVTSWLTTILVLAGLDIPSFGTVGIMIVMMHYIGRFIESRLRDKASKQVRELLTLQPRDARVVDKDKNEVMVPIDAVKPESVIKINPGERIPLDGIIIEGESDIDESLLTGEPLPIFKKDNDNVTGGAMNLTSIIYVRTTKLGEDTFLSQMLDLVREAQGAKVPLQALADRITLVFVPAVITFAIISAIVWILGFDSLYSVIAPISENLPWSTAFTTQSASSIALYAFIATMVIACPCALGLATPIALVAATGEASRNGLLVRNAEAVQTINDVDIAILDKTGTITEGKPAVVSYSADDEVKKYAFALESSSGHPLAKAVRDSIGNIQFNEPDSQREESGNGVFGIWGNDEWFIGKTMDRSFWNGKISDHTTLVEVRKNNKQVGYFEISDSIREDTVNAIKDLKKLGIKPIMATGDSNGPAMAIAKQAGIEQVYSGIRPEEKLDIVQHEQSAGHRVLMVGDGINDAAALKGSDIGVAIGNGMDLAVDSSDIVIMSGGISRLIAAVKISDVTRKVIKQNLIMAFVYNIIAIPIAMSGLLHPVVAEVSMAASSITVVTNSLRILGSADK